MNCDDTLALGQSLSRAVPLAQRYAAETALVHTDDTALAGVRARYLQFADGHSTDRQRLVAQTFGEVETRGFVSDDTHFLSRARGDYDVLLIGGNDPARMGRYLRANRPLVANVARVAVVHGSTPPRRARLLNHGFDDVIDSARMTAAEAQLRIAAITARYAGNAARMSESEARRQAIAAVANPADLTPREFDILLALVRFEGQPVSTVQLVRMIEPRDHAAFKRSLKVIVSNLRKKIGADYRIEPIHRSGYCLERHDCTAPAKVVEPV